MSELGWERRTQEEDSTSRLGTERDRSRMLCMFVVKLRSAYRLRVCSCFVDSGGGRAWLPLLTLWAFRCAIRGRFLGLGKKLDCSTS